MKYIFFTFIGDSFPIAYKLQQEGHDVVVGQIYDNKDIYSDSETVPNEDIFSKKRRLELYDGMINKQPAHELIAEMQKYKNPEEYFVFFDRNNLFKYADKIREMNFHGNFPMEEDYLFEQDRDGAKNFVKANYPKLHVAEIKNFTKIEDAKAFLEDSKEIWVLKGKDDSVKTFVPDVDDVMLAKEQIIHTLESYQESYELAGFILELMISPMVEITPEKIYYDGKPLAITIDIENKPYGSGNISLQTGCAQDLVFPISMKDKINKIAFPPIVDEIAKKRKGLFYWDASILINRRSGKMYFGEFCSNRPGYNASFTEIAQCPNVNHYFESIANRKSPFTLGTVGSSVTLFNPNNDDDNPGHTVPDQPINFKESVERNLWLWDVKKKDGKLVTVGDDTNLAVVTGAGTSIDEAVTDMYKAVDNFSFVGTYNRPKFDYLSLDYPTSILNRLNYGLDKKLYQLPFDVRVGKPKI